MASFAESLASTSRLSYSSNFSTSASSTLSDFNDNESMPINSKGSQTSNANDTESKAIRSNCFYSRLTSMPISCHEENKLFQCAVLPPQHIKDKGKLTVVLDIDETLVHARLPDDIYRQDEERMDVSDSDYDGDTFEVSLRFGESFVVNKRPGLDEFLEESAKKYELIAYTAAVEEYARPLIDQLDPDNKIFRHRLYRSHCVHVNGHFVKDLRIVNRPLDRVVLVDNNAYCLLPQLNNGIPISSFYNDHTDTALNVLHKFLHVLHLGKDVQPMLKEAFNLEKILARDRDQLFAGHSYFS